MLVLYSLTFVVSCDPQAEQGPKQKEFKGPLICNFRDGHLLSNMSPQGVDTGDAVFYQGQIDLTLKLPGNREYVGGAFLVSVKKGKDGQISLFHITTRSGTLEEMHQLAKTILAAWNLPEKDLKDWVVKAGADKNYAFLFESMDNTAHPALTLSFHHSLVEEKPWCLFLEAYWGP